MWISVVTLSALLSGKKIRLCWCHSSLCLIVSLFSFSCFSMFRCSLRTCRRAANTLRRDSDILQNTKDFVLLSLFGGCHSLFPSQVLHYRSWIVVNVYAAKYKGGTSLWFLILYALFIYIYIYIKKRFSTAAQRALHCSWPTRGYALIRTWVRVGHAKVLSPCTLLSISTLNYLLNIKKGNRIHGSWFRWNSWLNII